MIAPGPIAVHNAPVGHVECVQIGGVWMCECGLVRMSRGALVAHHDDVRAELAQLGIGNARAAAQNISLAEISHACRAAADQDDDDLSHVATGDADFWA